MPVIPRFPPGCERSLQLMTQHCQRRIRKSGPEAFLDLLECAGSKDLPHKGSLAWMKEHSSVVETIYYVPLRERPDPGIIEVFAVILSARNRVGRMRVSVPRKEFQKLRLCKLSDHSYLALSLAVRSPVLADPSDSLS